MPSNLPDTDAAYQADSGIAPHQALAGIVTELRTIREAWRMRQERHVEYGVYGFPSRLVVSRIMDTLGAALFPIRLGPAELSRDNEDEFVRASLGTALPMLGRQLRMELEYNEAVHGPGFDIDQKVQHMLSEFASRLPAIRSVLDTDLEAAYTGDPAARSVDEILLCYPYVTAVIHHRLAHELYLLGAPLVARIMAEIAHSHTGIDIHPGASIGKSFFIDHGTGVVIGQTAIIGDRVRIYQAVTLGARSFAVNADGQLVKDALRHPIIEDDVTIYAGATILGRITIGAGSIIGGNVWLTRSVPPGSRVRQGTPSVMIEADPCE